MQNGLKELIYFIADQELAKLNESDEAGSEPLYHVTFAANLGDIADDGLSTSSGRSNFGSGYASHSNKGLFLTEKSGVNFWYERLENMAVHSSDNILEDELVPVVLKIDPEGFIEDDLEDDEPGSKDSRHDAFVSREDIPPEYIEIWNGSSWISIDNWDSIDIELALDKEEIEDSDGSDLEYHLFKYDNPLNPS